MAFSQLIWFGVIAYTSIAIQYFYKITYPPICEPIASGNRCYQPLLPLDSVSHVKLFVGVKSQGLARSTVIWENSRYQVGTDLTADIELHIPPSVRLKGETLMGWMVFSIPDSADGCDYSSGQCDALYNKANKAELERKLRKSQFLKQQNVIASIELTRMQRDMKRYESFLLNSTSSVNAESRKPTDPDALYPHFKYINYPLTVRVVNFGSANLVSNVVPQIGFQLKTHKDKSNVVKELFYEPITFVDDTTLMKRQCIKISTNTSSPNPKFRLKIISTHPAYFAVRMLIGNVLTQIESQGLLGEIEIEDLKRTLSDEYVYRYLLTIVISWVHLYLEYAAFKHDFSFFVGRKSFVGISASSLFMSLFRSVILFLYLQDAGSSWLILVSFAKDAIYTAWKIWNLLRVRLLAKKTIDDEHDSIRRREKQICDNSQPEVDNSVSNVNASVTTAVVSVASPNISSNTKLEFETAEYDRIAMTHVLLGLGPMAVGFMFYSLVFFTHKSWYSWVVSSLADTVYFFGFAALTPQLYINYKLKSVAHLPLRAFAYKTFSTFIDDVFAFIVDMPMKHRLMTLRDDVIFLGFLYQWYIYPTDKTRPNEFGFQYEGAAEQPAMVDSERELVSDQVTNDEQENENIETIECSDG